MTITGSQIQTHSGIGFDPINPDPAAIRIGDIAHALSNQCRFSGHVQKFLSVAQHCVLCSGQAKERSDKRTMLMHDASEAYLLDLPRPLKPIFPNYKQIEDHLMQVIAERFGFGWPMSSHQSRIDARMLFTEKRDLMAPADWGYERDPYPIEIGSWGPNAAKQRFLQAFYELFPKEIR